MHLRSVIPAFLFTLIFLCYCSALSGQVLQKEKIPPEKTKQVSELKTSTGIDIQKKTELRVPDDYMSIQEAVDAAAEGTTILVSGDRSESFSILGRKNLLIKGLDNASLSENYNPYLKRKTAFVISESENIGIDGFQIYGRGIITYSSGIEISNCDISGPGDGLSVLHSEDSSFKKNRIHLNTGGASDLGTGLFIYGSNGNSFSNNKIRNNEAFGIILYLSNDNVFNNNEIVNNVVGIELNTRCTGNRITNNQISKTKLWGIRLIDDANENILDNNSFETGDGSGIIISRSENNHIRNGKISYARYAGISILDKGSSNNIIEDVLVTNNFIGVEFELGASDCTFSNCEITQNTECDIRDFEKANTFLKTTYSTINCSF